MTLTLKILRVGNLRIRGTINKGKADEIIFQKTTWGLQHYAGPKIPQNPRVQNQQLQRVQFKAAEIAAGNLTEEQINYFRSLVPPNSPKKNWRNIFFSFFMKNHKYGQSKYGMGIYSTDNPPINVLRYGSTRFGDVIYSKTGNLPIVNENFLSKYPNIPFDH